MYKYIIIERITAWGRCQRLSECDENTEKEDAFSWHEEALDAGNFRKNRQGTGWGREVKGKAGTCMTYKEMKGMGR